MQYSILTLILDLIQGVQFAQINGMGDRISMGLVSAGFPCWKLVPCGTVSDVIPWLSRRMQENSDSFARTENELKLMKQELQSRFVRKKGRLD